MRVATRLHALLLVAVSLSLVGADWPRFRGPGGSGVSDSKGTPTEWSADSNIAWKTALPGPGASSPVIMGDKVFVTCYSGYGTDKRNPGNQGDLKYHTICLSLSDGKVLWDKSVGSKNAVPAFRSYITTHGYASSTPVVDKSTVYTFFSNSGVYAWSHTGTQLWSKPVGPKQFVWGAGTSPILHGGLLIVNTSPENGAMVALDAKTGDQAWSQRGIGMSWNTPIIVNANGRDELVVSVKGSLKAFDPAKGTPRWSCSGINDYVCPSVVQNKGIVYAIGGRQNTAVAVRAGGSGNVRSLWRARIGCNVSSPVYHDGYLYWGHDRGQLYCADAETGETAFSKEPDPKPDSFYASPVVADGHIYFVSRTRGTYVIAAKPELELVAHNVISTDRSVFNASPAIADGQVLLRSDRYLYCIGTK